MTRESNVNKSLWGVRCRSALEAYCGAERVCCHSVRQVLMEKESANPEFAFMFNLQSPEHMYFRWRMYSLAQGAPAAHHIFQFKRFASILLCTLACQCITPNFVMSRGCTCPKLTFMSSISQNCRQLGDRGHGSHLTRNLCRRHAACVAGGAVCDAGGRAAVAAAADDADHRRLPPDGGAARRRSQSAPCFMRSAASTRGTSEC